jgi:prepilin-type N-terminal cleavage/methylation domain-containing protein
VFDQLRSDEDHKNVLEQGFTLVELLIVIIILGILAGIVVFAVGNLTNSSKTSACATEATTFQTAYNAFVAANPGVKPGTGAGTAVGRDSVIADLTNATFNGQAVAHATEAAKGPFLSKAPNSLSGLVANTPKGFWNDANSVTANFTQANVNTAASASPVWAFNPTNGNTLVSDTSTSNACQ